MSTSSLSLLHLLFFLGSFCAPFNVSLLNLATLHHNTNTNTNTNNKPLDEFVYEEESLFFPLSNFSWKDVELSKDYYFPVFSNSKEWLLNASKHGVLVDKGYREENKHRSVGCTMNKIKDWYEDAPPSFGNTLTTVLLYSEQHTGSSLLSYVLNNQTKSIVSVHELFCCDRHCEGPRSEAIVIYKKFMESLQFAATGVHTVVVGLQRKQFWNQASKAIDFPINNSFPVLLLIRQNALSQAFSQSGFHLGTKRGVNFHVKIWKIRSFLKETLIQHNVYKHVYCKLKKKGHKVMITSYESLLSNYTATMRKVTEFLGAKGDGPWWKKWGEGPGKGGHIPLVDKLSNVEQVRRALREDKKYPNMECLLDENCEWPSLEDCKAPALTHFPSPSPSSPIPLSSSSS